MKNIFQLTHRHSTASFRHSRAESLSKLINLVARRRRRRLTVTSVDQFHWPRWITRPSYWRAIAAPGPWTRPPGHNQPMSGNFGWASVFVRQVTINLSGSFLTLQGLSSNKIKRKYLYWLLGKGSKKKSDVLNHYQLGDKWWRRLSNTFKLLQNLKEI